MGTDIHMAIEVKRNGKWHHAVLDRPCDACDGKGTQEVRGEVKQCWWCDGTKKARKGGGYFDRNYDAFAMLADVRNRSGFAGVDTGDGFDVIAPPRGCPTI